MKLDILEAHDRLQQLQKRQSDVVSQGCEDCLKRNSLSLAMQARSPYVYIFGHPRTADDGFSKRFVWQPRLAKPKAQTNSYLFRALSHTDNLEVCWMIPPREMWDQYRLGNVTASKDVMWSINQFRYNRTELEKPFPDDVSEDKFKLIMLDIAREMDQQKMIEKLYAKVENE